VCTNGEGRWNSVLANEQNVTIKFEGLNMVLALYIVSINLSILHEYDVILVQDGFLTVYGFTIL
jgi:hypothetical protein